MNFVNSPWRSSWRNPENLNKKNSLGNFLRNSEIHNLIRNTLNPGSRKKFSNECQEQLLEESLKECPEGCRRDFLHESEEFLEKSLEFFFLKPVISQDKNPSGISQWVFLQLPKSSAGLASEITSRVLSKVPSGVSLLILLGTPSIVRSFFLYPTHSRKLTRKRGRWKRGHLPP